MVSEEKIEVEVAYARPDRQQILKVEGEPGLTAQQAVERSGILERFPEIDPGELKLGVFGKAVKGDQELNDGDRVEIYRPLIADPKTARKKKAKKGNDVEEAA